jgi:hypothetical protein
LGEPVKRLQRSTEAVPKRTSNSEKRAAFGQTTVRRGMARKTLGSMHGTERQQRRWKSRKKQICFKRATCLIQARINAHESHRNASLPIAVSGDQATRGKVEVRIVFRVTSRMTEKGRSRMLRIAPG